VTTRTGNGAGNAADSGLGLGQEGVDYQLGSVDDLEPSEWQVSK